MGNTVAMIVGLVVIPVASVVTGGCVAFNRGGRSSMTRDQLRYPDHSESTRLRMGQDAGRLTYRIR